MEVRNQIDAGVTPRKKPGLKRVGFGLLLLFLLLNVVVGVCYRRSTYPRTWVGDSAAGSLGFSELDQLVDKQKLPKALQLSIHDTPVLVLTERLGISLDATRTKEQAKKDRSWLPVLDLLREHHMPRHVRINTSAYSTTFARLARKYRQGPTNARIVLAAGKFSLRPEQNGWQLREQSTKQAMVKALQAGRQQIVLPYQTLRPEHRRTDLKPALTLLLSQQKIKLNYTYKQKTHRLSAADIAAFYDATATSYKLSQAKIKSRIIAIGLASGIGVKNLNDAAQKTERALLKRKDLTFRIQATASPPKVFGYCVATRGVPNGYLPDLINKLAAVYTDDRGWGLQGRVVFRKVTSGCNFTVWLSAANLMPSFGSICSPDWSCRTGPNVVINFDRWRLASDAWNRSGGSLTDYRSMVITHETGHWLGFGHTSCPSAGQLAPVMQQQSINLQGCRFNPWPTAAERADLRTRLNL